MEDNSLDGLDNQISQNTPQEGSARPKLRKIKRPKVRTTPDVPQAPKKEEYVDNNLSIQNDEQNMSFEAPNDETNTQSTDLITAVDANDIATGNEYNDQYILDGLPPELDYVIDEELDESNGGYVKKNILVVCSLLFLFVGIFAGKALFSSKSVEKQGLEGVVINDDVPAGRPRCGLTDKSQACVFYLMNWYKQELNGRDFYKLAAQLTGREEYMIETDNLRYATVKIKPGHFAQLNIPALK